MGRGGGRMGGSRGGFRGFSGGGSFSRGFSSRRSSSQRSSSVFSPGSRPSSAFYSDRQRLGRGGGISRNGYYRRTSGSSLWPLLFLPRNRTTVVVNNGSPVDPVSPSVPYEQPMPAHRPAHSAVRSNLSRYGHKYPYRYPDSVHTKSTNCHTRLA